MKYDTLIKNGKVVFRNSVKIADLAIQNGKIAVIADKIEETAKQVYDASGQYVMPGMVDIHVHMCEPGRTEWEGFETGTKALAAGGTTTYVGLAE
ncbi:amidohydrolase family protein [Heyndrickxia faecalis]|uniref:amidohydrolase family protein n=1 Tax=Heyndrickxia faecalis TaxID=2824910 RepID=UPI003D1C2B95